MSFFKFIAKYLSSYSIPVFKSFFRAYKDTTSGPRNNSQQPNSSGKRHPIDQMFKSMLSKTNLAAPPLDIPTALKILNIQQKDKQLDSKLVLERYYTLWKKNDPQSGGTVYLQSKVFAAKEALMTQFKNATQIQQQFYKQFVQPEQKAEQERKKKQQQQQNKKKQEQKQARLDAEKEKQNKK